MAHRLFAYALSAAIALSAAAFTAPAAAQVVGHPLNPPTAKQHRKALRHRHEPPRQIACTITGCHPIPARCHPEMGYTIDDVPTGFDIVVCP
jgi:hypothetical protein